MRTEKKTASNRKNAQKSTGPKSDAGKAVVSQNARTHGILSRNLIIKGESQAEFSELLCLLADEFQPVGLVEHALVERVGIALWRQRRLVRAESAEVSINRQRFGQKQKEEVGKVLDLESNDYNNIPAPKDGLEKIDDTYTDLLEKEILLWKSFIVGKDVNRDDSFVPQPEILQRPLFKACAIEVGLIAGADHLDNPSQIDSVVKEKFGSWAELFQKFIKRLEWFIQQPKVYEVSKLVLQSQGLPSKTDLLSRYQTALDNDLYKALKALREAQAWRQSKAVIPVTPVYPDGDGGMETTKRDP